MIELQPLGSIWIEAAVLIACLLALGYSVYATRFHKPGMRILVGSLRFVLLGFAWLLLHHPTWTHQTTTPREDRLAVLIDRSGSMGTQNDADNSRYERAYKIVQSIGQTDQKFDVFEFDQNLSENLGNRTTPGKLSGNKTDFHASISQLFSGDGDYSGVVLLSDGHDLGRFSQMNPDSTQTWLDRLGAPPINTIMVGEELSGPEIAIHSIDAPSFSFVRAPLRIRATVIVRNLDDLKTQVQLLLGEQVIKIKDLVLDDQGFGTVEFDYYPEIEGEHLFTIAVPEHHLESNVTNNKQKVLIDIGRDKINVLHIAGAITWDLQGLRAMFERDPLVDLTAFYIMRTRDHLQEGVDNRMIPHDEMALVPFPTEEIFDRQLFGFDIVVFHDFDSGTYFSDSYQARRLYKKIREFVTKHRGGFIVVGGPRTAGGPSLGLTPLADILPTVPPIQRFPYEDKVFEPRLTQVGEYHPILRSFDPKAQKYDGSLRGLTINKHASVLIEGQDKRPLLSVSKVGNGRTMMLNTSSSWKWRRDSLAAGGTGDTYYDFWEQALKWVIADPAMDQVRITATKTDANPLTADIDLQLRNARYEPLANDQGTLIITGLDADGGPVEVPFNTNSEGRTRIQYTAPRAGYYRLELPQALQKDSRPHTIFLGGSQDELRNLDFVPETMQRLASASGGNFVASPSAFDVTALERNEGRSQIIVETRRTKLRNWLWCLPLLLLISAIEWSVRRNSHLA